ncbi:T9SS type A sorting domain-containing protein [candidate division WOR-3 bacterium]|nr:T9SS type A sorting domain-containing protein [candidate division WOR-3 bacterium]
MRRIFTVVFSLLAFMVYAENLDEEKINQNVIVYPQNPEITQILQQMDSAKEAGDFELFRELLETYNKMSPPVKKDYPIGPDAEEMNSRPLESRWSGNDILIDSYSYGIQGISMDTRGNDLIYLAVSKKEGYYDVNDIDIYYSNNGLTWWYLTRLFWQSHHLFSPTLKIVETPDTDYIFVSFHSVDTATGNADVLVYRRNLVNNNYIYFYPANNPSVNELHSSIDSDDLQYPTGPYLYLTYRTGDTLIFTRSTNLGQDWVSRTAIAVGTASYYYTYPEVAYGRHTTSDSFDIGVVFVYRSKTSSYVRRIRFRCNYFYGLSSAWRPITYFTTPANHYDQRPTLRLTHGSMPSSVILFARHDTVGTDTEDLYEYYTYNGGRNWSSATRLYYGGDYNVLSCLSLDDSPNDYHAFFKGDYDDIRYKEAHYDNLPSGGWSSSIQISNVSNISEVTSPASAVLDTQPCVAFNAYYSSTYNLLFNALWLQTGVEEDMISTNPIEFQPNSPFIVSEMTYCVGKSGPVKISVFDITGRLIDNLINEYKESGTYTIDFDTDKYRTGVYFIRLKSTDGVYTRKISLIE